MVRECGEKRVREGGKVGRGGGRGLIAKVGGVLLMYITLRKADSTTIDASPLEYDETT